MTARRSQTLNAGYLVGSALACALALTACTLDDEIDDVGDSDEQGLSLAPTPKLGFQPTTPDRMTWDNNGGAGGEYWKVGNAIIRHRLAGRSSDHWVVGTAGDLVLWHDDWAGGPATLRTIDQKFGAVTATYSVPSPGPYYRAVSFTSASPLAWNCYRTGDEQNYYIMWNGNDGTYAVQLVTGTGHVRRTTFSDKPAQNLQLQAVWFGYGADGYEWAMFRDYSKAYRYRAQFAQTHYTHSSVRMDSLSGYQPMGMTAKPRQKYSLIRNATAWNDYILFANGSNGQARVVAKNSQNQPLKSIFGTDVVWKFDNSDKTATSYSYLPPVCD